MNIETIKDQLEQADQLRNELRAMLGIEGEALYTEFPASQFQDSDHDSYGHLIGERVIVRTRMSGVSIGTLRSVQATIAGHAVTLDDALRLWSWEGAFTLSEIALTGPTKKARTDKHPDGVVIAEPAIELLPMTDAAFAQLQAVKA